MLNSISLKAFIAFYFCFFSGFLFALPQYEGGKDYNPEALLNESKVLDEKAQLTIAKAALYQQEGKIYLDSARAVNNYIKSHSDSPYMGNYVIRFETNYMLAYRYIAMADSLTIVAESLRDLSIKKTKEAYAMMGMDVNYEISKQPENINNSSQTPTAPSPVTLTASVDKNISYVVVKEKSVPLIKSNEVFSNDLYIMQMGAGKMDMGYFSKLPSIETVTCRDGIKRYVLPGSFSKKEAYKKKEELVALGYKQIFIRTKESLDKIRD